MSYTHRSCHSSRLWLLLPISVLGSQALAANASDPNKPLDCAGLASQKVFENTTITSAKMQSADAEKHRPPFCEVTATANPVPGSNITIVVRMPDAWNGKLLGSGGGGWAGNTNLNAPAPGLPPGATPGLVAGYAVAQTNGGHDVSNVWDTSWSTNPEAVTDFSYRAIHVMTDVAKAIVATYYGKPQQHAYFEGCSTGGRQALMEVQRYPNDYQGVIAGAPVYTLTVQTMSVVRNQAFARAEPLTEGQLKRLQNAALAACDGRDGLVDGVITDPRTCSFDPASLQCGGGSDTGQENCLSPKQVQTLHTVYSGVKNAAGDIVAYPLSRGSEGSWTRFISAAKTPTEDDFNTGPAGAGLGGLRALVFNDANFDLRAFNVDKDYPTIRNSAFAAGYEAKDPDISAFVNAGGKLLLWHGMLDPGPSALATIEYFDQVKRVTSPKVKSLDEGARLFMAPGVYHCRGGPGADEMDLLGTIDNWVAHGQAPSALRATRTDGTLSRPVCQYPALPRYKSKGDPNAAESFICR